MWDTLVGGMVSAVDTVQTALARETWEEAGLRLDDLQAVTHGGCITTRRPSADGRGTGYVVEHIDWYHAIVPEGMEPMNQDGEVAQFGLWARDEVLARLPQDHFTTEAALILAAALGF
jgi:ADP-ribose pyrophosphatase YjhB (NUDIX family)